MEIVNELIEMKSHTACWCIATMRWSHRWSLVSRPTYPQRTHSNLKYPLFSGNIISNETS